MPRVFFVSVILLITTITQANEKPVRVRTCQELASVSPIRLQISSLKGEPKAWINIDVIIDVFESDELIKIHGLIPGKCLAWYRFVFEDPRYATNKMRGFLTKSLLLENSKTVDARVDGRLEFFIFSLGRKKDIINSISDAKKRLLTRFRRPRS
ncbi:MAG: hypothetical protein AB7F43_12745 [Bacteriovoracia bacterium]